jgi:hypothetical protein
MNRLVHWENPDIDLDWVMENHVTYSPGLVSKLLPVKHPPEMYPFIEFARSCFSSRIAVLRHVMIRVVSKNSVSETHPDYGEGFPDLHNNKHVTICVCVQEAEAGGDWEIDTAEGKLCYPGKTGNGVIIKGDEVHWATRVKGDRLRITLLAHFAGVFNDPSIG